MNYPLGCFRQERHRSDSNKFVVTYLRCPMNLLVAQNTEVAVRQTSCTSNVKPSSLSLHFKYDHIILSLESTFLENHKHIINWFEMWGKSSNSSEYDALGTSSDDLLAEDDKLQPHIHPPRRRRQALWLRIAPWFAHCVFFLISSTLLLRATKLYKRSQCWSGPPISHELGMSYVQQHLSVVLFFSFFLESISRLMEFSSTSPGSFRSRKSIVPYF